MRIVTLSLIALTAAMPAYAAPPVFQDTAVLDMAVAQFTGVPQGEDGGARTPVDRRLKLAACQLPQLEWRTAAHDAVLIRCMAPEWRIFVPVNQAAPAPMPAEQIVAAAPVKAEPVIKRGDAIIVEAGGDGFSISRDGVAMGDAAPGGRVLVKVEEKKPPVQAIAVEAGRATLPGWGE